MRLVGSIDEWARFRLLEEQVIADQFAEAIFDPSPAEDGHRIVEGVDLNLKFSLDPAQVQRICGDIVGQQARTAECQKFVENWLMHSSVAALNKYLEGK